MHQIRQQTIKGNSVKGLTDLLPSAHVPLIPFYHNRRFDDIDRFHSRQVHTTWLSQRQVLLICIKCRYMTGEFWNRKQHYLTVTSTDLYRKSDKKSGQVALHFSSSTGM